MGTFLRRLTPGTRVLIQIARDRPRQFGLVMDGPMFIGNDPFFKVRTDEHDAWYPVEHLGPYLQVVGR